MRKIKILKNIFGLLIVAILTLGLSISFQSLLAAWLEPTVGYPTNVLGVPINANNSEQTKEGMLLISTSDNENGLIVADGNTGIGVGNPQARLDVDGGVKVGFEDLACNTDVGGVKIYKGVIRYDDTNNFFQVCDGENWREILSNNCTCSADYYDGDNYCSLDGDVVRNLVSYSCNNNTCEETTTVEEQEGCGEDYCDPFGLWSCLGSDARSRTQTCYDVGCDSDLNSCYSNSYVNTVTEDCPYGCSGGVCLNCVPESDIAFCTRYSRECNSYTANDNCGALRTVASCGTCGNHASCSSGSCVCNTGFVDDDGDGDCEYPDFYSGAGPASCPFGDTGSTYNYGIDKFCLLTPDSVTYYEGSWYDQGSDYWTPWSEVNECTSALTGCNQGHGYRGALCQYNGSSIQWEMRKIE